jgi:hypothetical protein
MRLKIGLALLLASALGFASAGCGNATPGQVNQAALNDPCGDMGCSGGLVCTFPQDGTPFTTGICCDPGEVIYGGACCKPLTHCIGCGEHDDGCGGTICCGRAEDCCL